jgi:hypothetical protein
MQQQLDVFINGNEIAFTPDRTALIGRASQGFRYSRTISFNATPAPQGSSLKAILDGIEKHAFYIPARHG